MRAGPQRGKLLRLLAEAWAALVLESMELPETRRIKRRAAKRLEVYLHRHGVLPAKVAKT